VNDANASKAMALRRSTNVLLLFIKQRTYETAVAANHSTWGGVG